MKPALNKHHLIPSSKWWETNERNIVYVDMKEHTRRHSRCGNDTPVEAICRVLLRNEKIFTDNFIADILEVLDTYINSYYHMDTCRKEIKSEIQTVLNLEDNLLFSRKRNE